MGKSNRDTTIEKGKSFSESKIWALQRDYFNQQGIEAWNQNVPFYVTSNPYIANCYAQVFIRYLLDMVNSKQCDINKTFYILELCTGSGKFSFYCMKKLFELQKKLQLSHLKICYVMTDIAENNISFWEECENFRPFVESGQLDFAFYDAEQTSEIRLRKKNILLSEYSVENPIMVIANYALDTISHDIFRVTSGKLQEAKVKLTVSNEKNYKLDDIDISFKYKNVDNNPYDDPILNTILENYSDLFSKKTTTFLFPIASFRCFAQLKKISNNRLLLLSTDKGHTFSSELEGLSEPYIAMHGSFSMMVNFHAIGEYFTLSHGGSWHQSLRKSIKTSSFVFGNTFSELPETSFAIEHFLDQFGPGDFFNFHKHIKEYNKDCSLELIVSHLNLSHWDPRIFNIFSHKIMEDFTKTEHSLQQAIRNGLPKLAANIYEMPGAHEYYFDLAVVYHTLGEINEALPLYLKTAQHMTADYNLNYNIALCYQAMDDSDHAALYFKQAALLKPKDQGNRI